MKLVLGWSLAIGLIWLAALGATSAAIAAGAPDPGGTLRALNAALTAWGPGLGSFVAGPLTLAIILHVLLSASDRLGYAQPTVTNLRTFSKNFNVQAGIGIILIVAFTISAIGNVGNVSALKDIALVVVGFYFGDRKRSGELEDVAHTAALTAVNANTNDSSGTKVEQSTTESDSQT